MSVNDPPMSGEERVDRTCETLNQTPFPRVTKADLTDIARQGQ
jgi:hypothetical protein